METGRQGGGKGGREGGREGLTRVHDVPALALDVLEVHVLGERAGNGGRVGGDAYLWLVGKGVVIQRRMNK